MHCVLADDPTCGALLFSFFAGPEAKVTEICSDKHGDEGGLQVMVTGVRYTKGGQEHVLEADAVILATGGFGADSHGPGALLTQHAPTLRLLPTTNGAFATGDGVRLGAAAGASLVHMDQVQVHPTGFVDPSQPDNQVKFLAPEALRGCGYEETAVRACVCVHARVRP